MTTKSRQVPTAWQSYIWLPDDQRERLYQAWCRRHHRHPDLAESAEDFVFGMSATQAESESEDLEPEDLDQ